MLRVIYVVTNKPFMLSVIMLNVVMLCVVFDKLALMKKVVK